MRAQVALHHRPKVSQEFQRRRLREHLFSHSLQGRVGVVLLGGQVIGLVGHRGA